MSAAITPDLTSPEAAARELLLACLPVTPNPERLAALLAINPDWDELYDQGLHHQALPLIYQTLKEHVGQLVAESALHRFRTWFACHALRSLQMQKELRRVIDLLTAEKIAVIPYKGPVLAEEAYGDVALRSCHDLDLLVPPGQAWDAVHLLLTQGYRLGFDLARGRWASLQKTDNHLALYHPDHHWSVEVHWEPFHPMYLLPFDFAAHWVELEGGKEGRLTREETLAILCAHGTKHLWGQLKWLADLDRLLRNGPPMHWEKALLLGKKSGSIRALLLGLNLVRVLCGTPLPAEIIEKIAAESAVLALTEDVRANLFANKPGRRRFLREYRFLLQCREHPADRWKLILGWLFRPRQADWQVFPLGDRWYWLYYLERPVRMVWKWVLAPILSPSRDAKKIRP